MTSKKISASIKNPVLFLFWLMLLPLTAQASFIETTVGTAVLNDATASKKAEAAFRGGLVTPSTHGR